MLSVVRESTDKKYQTATSEGTEISFLRKEAKERNLPYRTEELGSRAKATRDGRARQAQPTPKSLLPSRVQKRAEEERNFSALFRRREIATERSETEISFRGKREEVGTRRALLDWFRRNGNFPIEHRKTIQNETDKYGKNFREC